MTSRHPRHFPKTKMTNDKIQTSERQSTIMFILCLSSLQRAVCQYIYVYNTRVPYLSRLLSDYSRRLRTLVFEVGYLCEKVWGGGGGWVANRILVSAPVPFGFNWGWNWVELGWD